MWANAQRDSRPAERTCRPLFNAAKFGKLTKRSQPLVGQSSPYSGGHLEDILLLNKFFFRLSICALVVKI